MSTINPLSVAYRVISGEHTGKICIIRNDGADGLTAGVAFLDFDREETVIIQKSALSKLASPGWPEKFDAVPYDMAAYWYEQKGTGSCRLRMPTFAQPRALREGDMLATSEVVLESPRCGWNNSALIRLDVSGCLEMPPRFAIALKGNTKFKFPEALKVGDKLITGCPVIKNSVQAGPDMTRVYLDYEGCEMQVPTCLPLAIA